MLKAEISKNIAINKLNADDEVNTDLATDKLDLGGQNLKDLAFLPKMIPEYTNLETIDLSNSDMRIENNVKQLCAMIDGNNTLQHLILQKCHINGNTLNLIADALCRDSNSNLKTVDIRENPIQDPQYKVLLGLMQANERLDSIEYTLNDQDNLHAVEQFKGLLKEGNDLKEATTRMKKCTTSTTTTRHRYGRRSASQSGAGRASFMTSTRRSVSSMTRKRSTESRMR